MTFFLKILIKVILTKQILMEKILMKKINDRIHLFFIFLMSQMIHPNLLLKKVIIFFYLFFFLHNNITSIRKKIINVPQQDTSNDIARNTTPERK